MEDDARTKRMERQARGVLRDHACECLDCEESREFLGELEKLLKAEIRKTIKEIECLGQPGTIFPDPDVEHS